MWETWVQPLGWEDPPREGRGYLLCILAWKSPWRSPWDCKESSRLSDFHFSPSSFWRAQLATDSCSMLKIVIISILSIQSMEHCHIGIFHFPEKRKEQDKNMKWILKHLFHFYSHFCAWSKLYEPNFAFMRWESICLPLQVY